MNILEHMMTARVRLGLVEHPRRLLDGLEHLSIPLCQGIAGRAWLKDLVQLHVRWLSAPFTYGCISNIIEIQGLERIKKLRPDGSIILVANHRSFFDMYIASSVLYRQASFLNRLYFPVRNEFFYTHPLGLLINLGISGGAMWPPIYRDERKEVLNSISMDQLVEVLHDSKTLVGIHPEATRNKSDDPYTFLPARPGVGELVRQCPASTLVVPYFMCGVSNDFLAEVRRNFRLPQASRGPKIRLNFGEPIPVGDLGQMTPAQEISDRLMGTIRALAEEERARQ